MNRAAALLAGVLVLGATAVPASATLSGAVSAICPVNPVEVATDMANTNSPVDPLPGSANCPALCDKWVSACKGAVAVAKSCRNAALMKLVSLRNAQCNVNTDAALKEACKSSLNDERKQIKAEVVASTETAKDFCEGGGLTVCLSKCD
jgi:hypothetical protein